jgi:histidine triad (HIT) family protein
MPITVPTGDCSFCAYLAGDRPYTVLRQDDVTATLVTREQRGLGHVIPVAHRETILDVTSDEAAALGAAVSDAAQAISRSYDPTGISVWQNNGVGNSQSVPHVHFHVAGTLPDGEGDARTGTLWGPVPKLSVAQTDAIADRLR